MRPENKHDGEGESTYLVEEEQRDRGRRGRDVTTSCLCSTSSFNTLAIQLNLAPILLICSPILYNIKFIAKYLKNVVSVLSSMAIPCYTSYESVSSQTSPPVCVSFTPRPSGLSLHFYLSAGRLPPGFINWWPLGAFWPHSYGTTNLQTRHQNRSITQRGVAYSSQLSIIPLSSNIQTKDNPWGRFASLSKCYDLLWLSDCIATAKKVLRMA